VTVLFLTGAEAENDTTQTAFTRVFQKLFCLCPKHSNDLLILNVKLTKHDDPWGDWERQLGLCVCGSGSLLCKQR